MLAVQGAEHWGGSIPEPLGAELVEASDVPASSSGSGQRVTCSKECIETDRRAGFFSDSSIQRCTSGESLKASDSNRTRSVISSPLLILSMSSSAWDSTHLGQPPDNGPMQANEQNKSIYQQRLSCHNASSMQISKSEEPKSAAPSLLKPAPAPLLAAPPSASWPRDPWHHHVETCQVSQPDTIVQH